MAENLEPQQVNVSEQTRFGAGGSVQRVTVVRYMIGSHGPFVDEFEPGDATAANIRAKMDNRIALIRSLGQTR